MTSHRTDVCVSFGAPTDPVAVPVTSKVADGAAPLEPRAADSYRELDPPADLDVGRSGPPAGQVSSTYVDYDAIDTLVLFIGHRVEERA